MRWTTSVWIWVLGIAPFVAAQQKPFYDVGTIEKIEINFKESNWRTILQNNWQAKIYIKAEVVINGVRFPDAGVRYRGNSTYFALPAGKNDKRPFKIALDEFVEQEYQGYKTLNLNNNLYDPTMVREVMGYELMRRFMPAPKCNYARLTINNEDFGIFVNTQQINKGMLREWWADEDGNRYRGQPTSIFRSNDAALVWLGSQPSSYQSAYELKTEQSANPWTDLINLCDKLNNTPANQRIQEVSKVLDVDNALRFLAIGGVALWLDGYLGRYVHNFYLYNDPTHGRFSVIPWDLNSCFGGYTDTLTVQTMKTVDPFWRENESGRPRPLFGNLVADPRLRARYLAHFRTMMRECTWAKLLPRIQQLQAFIGPEVQNDPKRVYSMAWFTQCVTQDIMVTSTRPLSSLKGAIDERAQFLATHPEIVKVAPTLSNLVHMPTSPSATTPVVVNVAVAGTTSTVTLHHRQRGAFIETRMFDDGLHGDGQANDGVYGATIPPAPPLASIEYFVTANSDLGQGGAMSILPETGGFKPNAYRVGVIPAPGGVQIHEFLAKNDTGIQDEMAEFEDWIELVNTSAQPIDVSGMYLTDNLANATKWRIPNGTTIPAGQTLLVWADDDPLDGPMHATFKLGAAGEAVALFATDGVTPLDAIEFGPQRGDVSTGRLAGYPAVWASFPSPTPRAVNTAVPCSHLAYGSLDSIVDPVALSATGSPTLGGTVNYRVAGGPFSTTGVLAVAVAPWQAPLPGLGSLLIDPTIGALLPIRTDAIGQVVVPIGIPNAASLGGAAFYLQAYVRGASTGGFSNALITRVCP